MGLVQSYNVTLDPEHPKARLHDLYVDVRRSLPNRLSRGDIENALALYEESTRFADSFVRTSNTKNVTFTVNGWQTHCFHSEITEIGMSLSLGSMSDTVQALSLFCMEPRTALFWIPFVHHTLTNNGAIRCLKLKRITMQCPMVILELGRAISTMRNLVEMEIESHPSNIAYDNDLVIAVSQAIKGRKHFRRLVFENTSRLGRNAIQSLMNLLTSTECKINEIIINVRHDQYVN